MAVQEQQIARFVDVRNMLCAQALMLIMHAVRDLPAGSVLEVRYNKRNVHRDLAAWAEVMEHEIESVDEPAAAPEEDAAATWKLYLKVGEPS